MNRTLQLPAVLAALAFALCTINAQADNSQQSKMTTCNADASAKNLSGDDRKAYLKTCLSAKPPAPASTTKLNSQQQKMKTCNADATTKGLTGDDRASYMSTCLKGSK
jgi:psiF repeat-containing protein